MSREADGRTQTPSSDGSADKGCATDGNNRLLDRRNYLKAAGATAAAIAGASGSASASSDYDVVKVPAGGHKRYNLDDGEVLENILFDCTASNTRVSIVATGRNWTIRNIGIKGVHDQTGGHAVLGLKAASGTDCLVENVWMGDGSSYYGGASGSETAAWVSPQSTGTITFRHCYIENWKDNGIYASAPGKGGNGPVVIEECYAANNNHADYRIGSTGSVVRNSVVEHTDDGADSRGIWCWYNPGLEVRNCQVAMNGHGASVHAGPYEPGEVDMYDTQYGGPLVEDGQGDGTINLVSGNGTSPDCYVPDGVPRSPEEAASGTASDSSEGGDSDFLGNTIRIDTREGADLVEYAFTTTGEVELNGDAEAGSDTVTRNDDGTWTTEGIVGDGYADSFDFAGDLVDVTLDGEATVYVNGEERTSNEQTDQQTHTIEISSTGEDRAFYEFSVTGDVEYGDRANPDADYPDSVDGSSASGSVALYGTDDYTFTGEVESAVVDGPAEVLVDGEEIPTQEPEPEPTHTIEISSTGEDRAFYEFSVTGDLEYGDRANPNADYPDEIDGSSASGSVALYGTDDYTFTGDLESVVVDGPVEVLVDGEEVSVEQRSTHELEISSTGEDRAFYEFSVTGNVEYGDRANPNGDYPDEIDGSNASGSVALYGTDDYTFTGDLESITVDGDATVYLDGEELHR